jgi:glycosyltransferase involved in cell wall biosynthesis
MTFSKDISRQPLVTVYIPCRNYGRFLSKAIQSVIDQLYNNWELVVIDEASDDDSLFVAERFRAQHPSRIRIVKNSKPLGLQKVANNVLGVANGKYFMRLDADDWLDEAALLAMVAKLESNKNYGLVYGNYYYTNENGEVLGVERRRKLGVEDASGHLPPHGACTMVNVRQLKAVGGYSEDLSAQDGWDLWFKLLNRVKSAHLDAPLFYYRQHGKSLSRDSGRLLDARADVFRKTRERLEGSYVPRCLAVIPVRESYPEWEGVPYEIINGRSLLELTLESAFRAKGVTDIIVSSSSKSVLDFSENLEKQTGYKHVRVVRPDMKDSIIFRPQEILLHALESFKEQQHYLPDIVLFLSIHAPFRESSHVDKAIDVLRVTTSDSVVSVNHEWEPIFCHGEDGLTLLNPGRFDGLAFEREHLFRFNGAIIALWSTNLEEGSLFGKSIAYIEMSDSSSQQIKGKKDIDRFSRV